MAVNITKLNNISQLEMNHSFAQDEYLTKSYESLNEASQGNYGLITIFTVFTLFTIWASVSSTSRFNFLQKMVWITGACTILSAFMLIFGFDNKWEGFSFFMSMLTILGILLYRSKSRG